jgi:hypothetical protein
MVEGMVEGVGEGADGDGPGDDGSDDDDDDDDGDEASGFSMLVGVRQYIGERVAVTTCGDSHGLMLHTDGSVSGYGYNAYHQAVPAVPAVPTVPVGINGGSEVPAHLDEETRANVLEVGAQSGTESDIVAEKTTAATVTAATVTAATTAGSASCSYIRPPCPIDPAAFNGEEIVDMAVAGGASLVLTRVKETLADRCIGSLLQVITISNCLQVCRAATLCWPRTRALLHASTHFIRTHRTELEYLASASAGGGDDVASASAGGGGGDSECFNGSGGFDVESVLREAEQLVKMQQ